MNHDIELAYVGIEVPDPRSLASFFGSVIGLLPGERPADGIETWRNDDKAHRLIVQPWRWRRQLELPRFLGLAVLEAVGRRTPR